MFVNWLISGMVYILKLIEWIFTFIFIKLSSVNSYPVCSYPYINQLNPIFLPYSSLVFLFLYDPFELSILLATFSSSCSSLIYLFLTFPLTNAVHSWKFIFLPPLNLSTSSACCLSISPLPEFAFHVSLNLSSTFSSPDTFSELTSQPFSQLVLPSPSFSHRLQTPLNRTHFPSPSFLIKCFLGIPLISGLHSCCLADNTSFSLTIKKCVTHFKGIRVFVGSKT